MSMDYSLVQRIIDGTGRILDTTMSNPNTGSYITEAQLRDWIKGQTVQEGYYYNGNFYSNSGHTSLMAKVNGSLYVDKGSNALYYCLSSAYVALTEEAAVQAIRTELLNGTLEPLVSTKAKQDANGDVIDTTYAKIAELLDGTVVPLKAKQDQNGNVIDTTYATKAELATEQNARESADSDLQSQIVNINSEVDNIEALIGDEALVENVDDTPMVVQSRLIHHVNLLPNGSFGRVGARSVAWNQLIKNGNFEGSANWANNATNTTLTVAGNVATLTMKTDMPSTGKYNWGIYQNIGKTINGHKYLIRSKVKSEGTSVIYDFDNSSTGRSIIVTPNVWTDFNVITASTGANTPTFYLFPEGLVTGQTLQIRDVNIIDLTLIYGAGNEPSTIAGFSSKFPASYYPYDEGHIYDLNPSGFRIRGINLWNEEWETGTLNVGNGENVASTQYSRSIDYIPCLPSTAYYGKTNSNFLGVLFYGIDKTYIAGQTWTNGTNRQFTSIANAYYMRFVFEGQTYNYDIQICDNSLPDAIKQTYHSYEKHTVETPQISDGHYVNEDVYDYVENVVEDGIVNGKKHKVVGTIVYDGSSDENWVKATGNFFYIQLNTLVKAGSEGYANKLLCDKLISVINDSSTDFRQGTKVITGYRDSSNLYPNQNWIYVRIDDTITSASLLKAWLASNPITVYYELAEEEITDCEPLRSFPISDYSTVEPITPQDELVNRIDVPFSVKSVSANTLIEQITQNTADIAEEKAIRSAQVSALDKRVTNLELKTGDQFEVDYPSSTYGMNGVPSDVEPYAEVKALRGVGRVANNLVAPSNLRAREDYGVTITANADGTITVSGTAEASTNLDFTLNNFGTVGHSYVVCGGKSNGIIAINDGSHVAIDSGAGAYLANTTGTVKLQFPISNGVTYNVTITPCVTDLNICFNGSIPTNAQTIAQIQTNYPELLEPSEYNTGSAVFSTYSAVKSVGVNIWDEEWELGDISDSTGAKTTASDRIRSKNFIPVKPSTEYYFLVPTGNGRLFYYDAEKNFISAASWGVNTYRTTPQGCAYVLFTANSTYGTTYHHDIQICLNSYADKATYHPYMTDTLTLPEPVTLKGAGAVAEEYYPESGSVTHPTGEITVTSSTGMNIWGTNVFSVSIGTTKKVPTNSTQKPNILLAGYMPVSYADRNSGEKTITIVPTGFEYPGTCLVRDTSCTTVEQMRSAILNQLILFELATPAADTYVDPILNPYVKVEPNGTVKPVQSQSPEVDSAMTVEYMAS